MVHTKGDRLKTARPALTLGALAAGLVLAFAMGRPELASTVWIVGVVPVLAALMIEILRSLTRGEVGLDIVAALSMTAALLFGETLAAAVGAVMYFGGTFLESSAEGRARREMRDLLSRVIWRSLAVVHCALIVQARQRPSTSSAARPYPSRQC